MSWRDAMNDDIKSFFELPDDAVINDIDITQEERGYGCSTCRFMVFVVQVDYRTETGARGRETFEGSLTEFLTAVSEAAEAASVEDDEATAYTAQPY